MLVAGIAVIGAVVVGIDAIHQATKNDTQEGTPSTSEVRASIREFDTDYFSFTAPSGWRSIKEETSSNVFVFRSYRGTLVENELKVYINNPEPENLAVSRVMPVRIDEASSRIIPTQISEHCSKAAGTTIAHGPIKVSVDEASFLCNIDETNFTVIVSEKGGGTTLRLKRSDGTIANYSFLFRSSTVPPETTQFVDILNSFDAI